MLDRTRPDRKPDDASEVVNTLYNCFNSLVIKNNVLCRKWIDKTENEREQELTNEHEMIRPRNYVRVEPRVEPVNLRYNLRRDRRQPDRYGLPVYNY